MNPLAAATAAALLSVATAASGQAAPRPDARLSPPPMPHFRYDTAWLKLPPKVFMGEVTAVAVDRRDHLWVLHRPRTVKDHDPGQVAPPIMEFDQNGRYLRGFGGPAGDYEWPEVEHTLAVSANGEVWVAGSSRTDGHGDDMLLVFDHEGRFLRQIGRRNASAGNFDPLDFHAPADIFVDHAAHEVYVADGYGNQRVVVLDERDGRFLRMWSAFGLQPPSSKAALDAALAAAPADGPRSFNGVHGVEKSKDGRIYVSDRLNQRIQVFTPAGRYLGQTFVDRGLASATTASGITFSRDPGQRYLFVADWGNGKIVVIDRRSLSVIGAIGQAGDGPGEFHGPHLIDTDSKGVIYVAEVQGRRVQRLVPAR